MSAAKMVTILSRARGDKFKWSTMDILEFQIRFPPSYIRNINQTWLLINPHFMWN